MTRNFILESIKWATCFIGVGGIAIAAATAVRAAVRACRRSALITRT